MVIVISSQKALKHEADLINELFHRGMPLFHLRKPTLTEVEMAKLLSKIEANFHSRISLHDHHQLAEEFEINRLHFPEAMRITTNKEKFIELKNREFTLSTSIHALEDYASLPESFDYTFISPVYNSISKPEYTSVKFDLNSISENRKTKLIGLGGISSHNCMEILKMGFDGMGVLGAIWEAKDKHKELNTILKSWPTIVR